MCVKIVIIVCTVFIKTVHKYGEVPFPKRSTRDDLTGTGI